MTFDRDSWVSTASSRWKKTDWLELVIDIKNVKILNTCSKRSGFVYENPAEVDLLTGISNCQIGYKPGTGFEVKDL